MENVYKIGTGIVALMFGLNGLIMMFAPETGASSFNILADGAAGLNTVRADLGGLFLGGAVLAVLGLVKDKTYLLALAIVVTIVIGGRVIGLMADGFAITTIVYILIEGASVAVLLAQHTRSDK